MRRRLLSVLVLAAVPAVLAAPPAAAAPTGPGAVVVLGDSAASGEGAGDYEPGTRGEGGNWCHRSPHAYAHRLGAPRSVVLACSGARAADVALGGVGRYGEGSQAQRLGELARRVRVTTVLVQVGANDDPAVAATAVDCVRAFLLPAGPGCRETVGPRWAGRVAAMAPKVETAVTDVRAVLRDAGAGDADVVLLSYASPVTERAGSPAVRGCPFRAPDAAWARTVAVPQLSDALRGVAEATGVRFLALDRAAEGREACSRPTTAQEWQRRLTVDPRALVYGGLDEGARHLAQESFHPSAAGHAELGRCAGEFLRGTDAAAACRVGADGHLRAVPLPAPADSPAA